VISAELGVPLAVRPPALTASSKRIPAGHASVAAITRFSENHSRYGSPSDDHRRFSIELPDRLVVRPTEWYAWLRADARPLPRLAASGRRTRNQCDNRRRETVAASRTSWRAVNLTHPYFRFTEAGYEVEVFSPKGGKCEPDAMSDPVGASQWQAEDVISRGYKHDPTFAKLIAETKPVDDIDLDRRRNRRRRPTRSDYSRRATPVPTTTCAPS
jgi:hypothetical protein